MSFFYNEPSGRSGFLDVVAEKCAHYMKVGGGALSAECLENRGAEYRRMKPGQRVEAERLICTGHHTATEIARMVGSNQSTIRGMAGRLGVQLRDGRVSENKRRAQA